MKTNNAAYRIMADGYNFIPQKKWEQTPTGYYIVPIDQLILEHSGTSWWVHVSCRINFRRNRHQALKLEKR